MSGVGLATEPERLALLTEASSLLATALEPQDILQRLGQLVVPPLADGYIAEVVRPGGHERECIRVTHGEPGPDLDHGAEPAHVLRTGQSVLQPTRMMVPLRAGGETIGVLTLGAVGARVFGTADLAFAELLGRLAGVALSNAWHVGALQADREQLRLERKRLTDLMSTVPGVVWESWGQPDAKSQRINFVSDYVTEMLGYSRDEWLSTPNFWLTIVHPEDREGAADRALRKFRGETSPSNEFRWVAKDGRVLHVQADSLTIHDASGVPIGMRGITLDVTERKRAEERVELLAETGVLVSSGLDVTATLEAIAHLLVKSFGCHAFVDLVDDQGHISGPAVVVNRDPEREALARDMLRRYPPGPDHPVHRVVRTRKPELLILDEAFLATFPADSQHRQLIERLELRSSVVVPLMARGTVVGVMSASARDRVYTADDVVLANELGTRAALAIDNARLFEAAQEARHRAEQANRAKDEFLAMVSHELRTPLNAMLGWTRLLRTGDLDPEKRARALDTIERNAQAQAQLIEDLLDISRIVAGKLRLDLVPVHLATLVEGALEAVRPAADAKGVRLLAHVDVAAPPLSGDAHRLQQVVWNLMSNAVKFTPRGGQVEVHAHRRGRVFEIRVEDTGKGISPAFLPHVFEQFRQAEGGTTRAHGGLGLGLTIAKHLVELHGGTIEARSEGEGQGATFAVELPAAPIRHDSPSRPALPAARPLPQPAELSGLRILVLDDEADSRDLLATVLSRCNAQVVTADTVQGALAEVETKVPDVIISDIGMPVEDGYVFIERLRRLPADRGGRTRAVALTAYSRMEDRTRALLAGFDVHVAKPVEPAELMMVLASLVRRGGAGR